MKECNNKWLLVSCCGMEACVAGRKQQACYIHANDDLSGSQTLADLTLIESLWDNQRTESLTGVDQQRSEDDVQAAMVEGLVCPALIELVCAALRSPGRKPGGLQASRRPPEELASSACGQCMVVGQEPRPQNPGARGERTSTLQWLGMQ